MNSSSKKKRRKLNQTQKLLIIIVAVVLVIIGYGARAVYYNFTGAVETETITESTEYNKINASGGIVVRDEGKSADAKNKSLLFKSGSGIYTPVVADGESVAKSECVAYILSDKSQVQAVSRSRELGSKIALLKKLRLGENLSGLDLSSLNSEISAAVRSYIAACDSNDFSDYDSLTDNLCYKITSKQIMTGQDLKLSAQIDALTAQKEQLDASLSGKREVNASLAGYFVGSVDGYEGLYDYQKIEDEGLTPKQFKKLKKLKAKEYQNVYGKIIGEHAWYYCFTVPFLESSNIKLGKAVAVSFPERGINDVQMKVHKITRDGSNACVVLKCMTMNDDVMYLRHENAVVSLESHTGLKISSDAIRRDESSNTGVYVHVGTRAVFKPVTITYKDDDFVLASVPTDDEGNKTVDETHEIKEYDRVILKGRNLYDGKVIN